MVFQPLPVAGRLCSIQKVLTSLFGPHQVLPKVSLQWSSHERDNPNIFVIYYYAVKEWQSYHIHRSQLHSREARVGRPENRTLGTILEFCPPRNFMPGEQETIRLQDKKTQVKGCPWGNLSASEQMQMPLKTLRHQFNYTPSPTGVLLYVYTSIPRFCFIKLILFSPEFWNPFLPQTIQDGWFLRVHVFSPELGRSLGNRLWNTAEVQTKNPVFFQNDDSQSGSLWAPADQNFSDASFQAGYLQVSVSFIKRCPGHVFRSDHTSQFSHTQKTSIYACCPSKMIHYAFFHRQKCLNLHNKLYDDFYDESQNTF